MLPDPPIGTPTSVCCGLAKKMLGLRPDIPIIICTGFSEQVSAERVEEIGIKRVLMKPLAIRELASAIREVLDKG